MKSAKIFFSYSRTDASDFSLKLAGDLKKEGFKIWIDQQDIRAGSEWDIEIEKALETCDCLLFVESLKSVTSTNVLDEVYYALEQKKRVIPVIIHDSKTPFRLQRLQYIDFRPDYDLGLTNLLKALRDDTRTQVSNVAEEESPQISTSIIKKYLPLIIIALLIMLGVFAIVIIKSINAVKISAEPEANLMKTFAGTWVLKDVEPKVSSQNGYIKIEETEGEKVTIISSFQFTYFKTNDTAFLSVFNGIAGCRSCILQSEMKLTDKSIDIGTQEYKRLKNVRPGDKRMIGDSILNASANNSIRASVYLSLIQKDKLIIKVSSPVPAPLSSGFIVEPFSYSFTFRKSID